MSSWGATEGIIGFRGLVQSSADTSSTLIPPTWFLWVVMSAVSCLSLTSSAFIKDLTVAWLVLCSGNFWGLPWVCLPLCDLLATENIWCTHVGCPQGKSSCCGCSASCAGAGKSCFSGNIWRAESYRIVTQIYLHMPWKLFLATVLFSPALHCRSPLFLDVRR